jgi:osmoprotectant transport system ATP-binding protein
MIEIDRLTKEYVGQVVVDAVSLDVQRGEICVIVGTSGSGKTTLMRMINRLVEPTSGSVRIDGRDTRDEPAFELRRRIGYAIQGHGLFPHWSVAQNIGTVPRLLGWDRGRIDTRVGELLELFQLDAALYRDRLPVELSGGQQQRVGVARALAAEPSLLLMDEPFGALDPIIRHKAQADLLAIQRRFGTTIVLVTHDMDEAIALGDRIAVMDQGKLLQYAPPAEIIARPATDFVSELLGPGDRAFRLLSLLRVREALEPGDAPGDPVSAEISMRDAYAEALWSSREALPVADDGKLIGRVTRDALARHAARPQ